LTKIDAKSTKISFYKERLVKNQLELEKIESSPTPK